MEDSPGFASSAERWRDERRVSRQLPSSSQSASTSSDEVSTARRGLPGSTSRLSAEAAPGRRQMRGQANAQGERDSRAETEREEREGHRRESVWRWLEEFSPSRRLCKAKTKHAPVRQAIPNGHDRSILCLDVHPSGDFAVSGSADHALRLFRLPTRGSPGLVGELMRTREGHVDWVTCCAFTSDNCVVSGGMDGKLFLWETRKYLRNAPSSLSDSRKSACTDRLNRWEARVAGADPRDDGEIAEGREVPSASKTVTCRASTNKIAGREFRGSHLASISGLQVSPWRAQCTASVCSGRAFLDGSAGGNASHSGSSGFCMTAGYDGFLRLWSLQTLREVVALSSVSPVASLLEPSPLVRFLWANAFACAGSKAGDLKVWDVNAGRLVCTSLSRPRAGRHAGGVASLRLWASPACGETGPVPLLFSGGVRDGQLCVWDLRAFSSPVATLHAHAGSLNEILFMADAGADACTLGADGACRFWDLRSASFAGAAPGETRAATRAAPHALLREICLGGPQHGFLCGEVAGRGSVCGGSGDGAVYCLSAAGDKEDSRKSESRVNALEMRGLRWKLACDANGAVQVLRAVVTPENAAVGIKQDGLGTGRERREIVHGLVAGGDDGQLSFIGFE